MEEIISNPGVIEGMVTLIIAVLATLTGAAVYAGKKIAAQAKQLDAVQHQVVNGHGPDGKNDNLRAQMDRIETIVNSGFRRVDKQYGELHRVVTQETEDRQALQRAKDSSHERIWRAIDEIRKREDGRGQ